MTPPSTTSAVVIVTGASRGIGLAIVHALLQHNARVIATARTPLSTNSAETSSTTEPSSSPSLAELVKTYPDALRYVAVDVTDERAAGMIVGEAISAFGRLDALVHNAGILDPLARIVDAPITDWVRCFDINLFSCVRLLQEAIPHLRTAASSSSLSGTSSRFILISSGAAVRPTSGWSAYSAAKSASNMLVASVAVEEPLLTSIAIRPGVVDTAMQARIRSEDAKEAMGEEGRQRFVGLFERGELLKPETPGSAVARLALSAPRELNGLFVNWDDERLPK
ncbi:uncharacterized protein EV422DRAFT_524787 [Fimicolochytrium jonesii]|uniref:uncharacterized protein n=1 Tax=Fimicolochytrium jonesii TaxID=1396493 RepID=UPI0022FED018|nr:uncharacterized protein EV422DRAFT_524787 [Fimicolochytrium jonesii]KAI8822627.1 hypothetical protein EV422DRAFT_524787 [Fimicolochytrium jonesii]